MAGPLTGVRVIDASAVVSGPFAAMVLADQGADVVKVEPPGGEIIRALGFGLGDVSAFYLNCNRGKRSLALDLGTEGAREVMYDLVRGADVFIENFRPGAMDRLGLGYGALAARNPALIHVSVTGFGPTGPYAGRRVYDPIIQGLTGHVAVQFNREAGAPDLVRTVLCDKATALTVAQAVSAALFARERGAGGQHIDVPMLDAALAFFWPDGMVAHTVLEDGLNGLRLYDIYRLTPTADGHFVYLMGGDKEWVDLCRCLGREDLLDDPRFAVAADRFCNTEALGVLLAEEFAKWSTADVVGCLSAGGVACGPVLSIDDVFTDPQIAHNEVISVRRHPNGAMVREPRPPIRFGGTPTTLTPLAPALGAHSDEVLTEIGYDDARISELRAAGIVA